MTIETERLELVLLTPEQLHLWWSNIYVLEKELNCIYKAEPVEGFFKEILQGQDEKAKIDPENYLFYSFFFMIRKEDRIVVGSSDYKNPPNEKGEV